MMPTKSKKGKIISKIRSISLNGNGIFNSDRLEVQKTHKLYIGGKFPRTESGRYYKLKNDNGDVIANICRGSRKDFRETVVSARNAFSGWSKKTPYNRGQIIYRMAEVMEGRKSQLLDEMLRMGYKKSAANSEILLCIDRLVYYAGWTDKYQQIFSSVNPVAASYFNFSVCEPTGVVAIVCPQENALAGLVSLIIPVICGGNTAIALASEKYPLCATTFAEIINSSDVPGGTINIITGKASELIPEQIVLSRHSIHGPG